MVVAKVDGREGGFQVDGYFSRSLKRQQINNHAFITVIKLNTLNPNITKTADRSSRPKNHFLLLYQIIQEVDYIPTPITAKMLLLP